jgi:hypothetical protein
MPMNYLKRGWRNFKKRLYGGNHRFYILYPAITEEFLGIR